MKIPARLAFAIPPNRASGRAPAGQRRCHHARRSRMGALACALPLCAYRVRSVAIQAFQIRNEAVLARAEWAAKRPILPNCRVPMEWNEPTDRTDRAATARPALTRRACTAPSYAAPPGLDGPRRPNQPSSGGYRFLPSTSRTSARSTWRSTEIRPRRSCCWSPLGPSTRVNRPAARRRCRHRHVRPGRPPQTCLISTHTTGRG